MTTSSTYLSRVWENINQYLLQDDWRSKRYRITRDIVSTQIRHHKIHLQASDICLRFAQTDTLIVEVFHTETPHWYGNWCEWGRNSCRKLIFRHIPGSWLGFPSFCFRLWSKQSVVLWLLSRTVHYAINSRNVVSILGYVDFVGWRRGEASTGFLAGKPEGKRPLGRPKRRWADNIK